MGFQVVNQAEWPRREHFEFFSSEDESPLYQVTSNVDVTALHRYTKAKGLSFYYALIWLSTATINNISAFRYKIRGSEIIYYDQLIPSFTDLEMGMDLFKIVVVNMEPNLCKFVEQAKIISKRQKEYFSNDLANHAEDSLIQYSCLPWFSFTSLVSERSHDNDDSIPKITWGRYERRDGRLILPYSIQVNHRLIDGFHLGQFFNQLQVSLDNFQPND